MLKVSDCQPARGAHWSGQLEYLLGRYIACPALILLAVATFYGVGGGNTALALLILTTLAVLPANWPALARDPKFWLTVLYVIWVPVSAAGLAAARPEAAPLIWDHAGDWVRTLFLPVLVTSFWLARFPQLIRWLPLLLACGFTLRVLEMTTPEMLADFVAGRDRATYGNAATHFGMYSLIVLIAAVTSISPIRQLHREWMRVSGYVLAVGISLIALGGLVFSQTRTAWLATLFASTVMVMAHLRRRRTGGPLWRPLLGALVVSISLTAILTALFHEIVIPRVAELTDSVWRIIMGDLERLPYDSVGYRLRAYAVGLSAWLEQPWFGHGPGIDKLAMQAEEQHGPQKTLHFHNAYINVLATYGLVGFGMFCALVSLLWRKAIELYRAAQMEWSTALFLVGAAATFLFCSLFDQTLTTYRTPFLLGILGALACTANGKEPASR